MASTSGAATRGGRSNIAIGLDAHDVSIQLALAAFALQVIVSSRSRCCWSSSAPKIDFWGVVSASSCSDIEPVLHQSSAILLLAHLRLVRSWVHSPGLTRCVPRLAVMLSCSAAGGEGAVRAMFLEEMGGLYVRTVRAKAWPSRRAVPALLRNALIRPHQRRSVPALRLSQSRVRSSSASRPRRLRDRSDGARTSRSCHDGLLVPLYIATNVLLGRCLHLGRPAGAARLNGRMKRPHAHFVHCPRGASAPLGRPGRR